MTRYEARGRSIVLDHWPLDLISTFRICMNVCTIIWFTTFQKWHSKMSEKSLFTIESTCSRKWRGLSVEVIDLLKVIKQWHIVLSQNKWCTGYCRWEVEHHNHFLPFTIFDHLLKVNEIRANTSSHWWHTPKQDQITSSTEREHLVSHVSKYFQKGSSLR